MKEHSFDVLATALGWVLCCALFFWLRTSSAFLSEHFSRAPAPALSHYLIPSQPVLQSPLWPYDLPPPREPAEPTFSPRPQTPPAPLERRNGLIPRAQRRSRPAIDPSLPRPAQRERLMTEMSHGERARAVDRETAQEKYLAQREDDRVTRINMDAAEAAREAEEAVLLQEAKRELAALGGVIGAGPKSASEKHVRFAEEIPGTAGGEEERSKTADIVGSTKATESGDDDERMELDSPKTADEIDSSSTTATKDGEDELMLDTSPKTADWIGSTQATEDGDKQLPKTADTISNTGATEKGQSNHKGLAIITVAAPYRGNTEAVQGNQLDAGINNNALSGTVPPAVFTPAEPPSTAALDQYYKCFHGDSCTSCPGKTPTEASIRMEVGQGLADQHLNGSRNDAASTPVDIIPKAARDFTTELHQTADLRTICEMLIVRLQELRVARESGIDYDPDRDYERRKYDENLFTLHFALFQWITNNNMIYWDLSKLGTVEIGDLYPELCKTYISVKERYESSGSELLVLILSKIKDMGHRMEYLMGNIQQKVSNEAPQGSNETQNDSNEANANSNGAQNEDNSHPAQTGNAQENLEPQKQQMAQNEQHRPAQISYQSSQSPVDFPALPSDEDEDPDLIPTGQEATDKKKMREGAQSMPTIKESQEHEMGTEEQMGLNTKEEMKKPNGQTTFVHQQQFRTQPAPPIQQPPVPNPPLRRPGQPARNPNQRQGQHNPNRNRPRAPRPRPTVTKEDGPRAPPPPRPTPTKDDDEEEPQWATRHGVEDALAEDWEDQDIMPNKDHRPLQVGKSSIANMVLVKTWLEQNNDTIDEFRSRLRAPEFKGKDKEEQYKLLLGQGGVQPYINWMSERYEQLREYTCVKHNDTGKFGWNVGKISLQDIRDNDLEVLIAKDMELMSSMHKALKSSSFDESNAIKTFKEAYKNVLVISNAIKGVTSPSGMFTGPTSGPLAGSESSMSEFSEESEHDPPISTGLTSRPTGLKQVAPQAQAFGTGPNSNLTGPPQAILQAQTFGRGLTSHLTGPPQGATQAQAFGTGSTSHLMGPPQVAPQAQPVVNKVANTWPNGRQPGKS